jgi:hypothetical protein
MSKQPWGFDHHVIVGRELKQIRDRLGGLVCETGHHYPLNAKSNVRGKADKAFNAVDSLRCALDSQLARDHPERFDTHVYYGDVQ